MSFITKRDRVFSGAQEGALPGRNEGKLKAYKSCADTRAWSHYLSDKSEHLFEVIKRNGGGGGGAGAAQLIPTAVIVDTLLGAKNAEIARLRRKLAEYRQLLAAYDRLDLTCDHKCQIARAHDAIRAANKEMEELFLDLSGAEGQGSEAWETGKSRGDEWSDEEHERPCVPATCRALLAHAVKSAASSATSACAPSCRQNCTNTSPAGDPRLLQEEIISKDAKLSAMQNTIEILESDVCEPYCVYAHIYTALERIFGILRQNSHYRLYLEAFPTQDASDVDIKGKILFKLKVLEKFCAALTSTCKSCPLKREDNASVKQIFHARILANLGQHLSADRSEQRLSDEEASYRSNSSSDGARTKLVAEIIDSYEMKQAFSNGESRHEPRDLVLPDSSRTPPSPSRTFLEAPSHTAYTPRSPLAQTQTVSEMDQYDVVKENLSRLKHMQVCYAEIVARYEDLQVERDALHDKLNTYDGIERELEELRYKLKDYSVLWTEKEHFRRRSEELDMLKEHYLLMSEEVSAYELRLKAAYEINDSKTTKLAELTSENITLEKDINELTIEYEKENNLLQCKLKETECQVMCQEQQIKSLLGQVDRMIEQESDKCRMITQLPDRHASEDGQDGPSTDRVQVLKSVIDVSEQEKLGLQDTIRRDMDLINELRESVNHWRGNYEKITDHNKYLKNCYLECKNELESVNNNIKKMQLIIEDKNNYITQLTSTLNDHTEEIKRTIIEVSLKNDEIKSLHIKLNELKSMFSVANKEMEVLKKEKCEALVSVQLSQRESERLLERTKSYDNEIQEFIEQKNNYEFLKNKNIDLLMENNKKYDEIERLREELESTSTLVQDQEYLKKRNFEAEKNITSLEREKNDLMDKLITVKKESSEIVLKVSKYDSLEQQYRLLQEDYDRLHEQYALRQKDLYNRTEENNHLMNTLKSKMDENIQINSELKRRKLIQSEADITINDLESQNARVSESLELVQTESSQLLNRLNTYKEKEVEQEKLNNDYMKIIAEKNKIETLLENSYLANKEQLISYEQLKEEQEILKKHFEENAVLTQGLMAEIKDLEHAQLSNKKELNRYFNLENKYDKLRKSLDNLNDERDALQGKLMDMDSTITSEQQLQKKCCILTKRNEELEKSLGEARQQMSYTPALDIGMDEIMKDIEQLRIQNSLYQRKVSELMKKLELSEEYTLQLSEDVISRDNNIAILENHINRLEEEIRSLQENLAAAVESGEEMSARRQQAMESSLGALQAHHSKATHNMKLEIASLLKVKDTIEKELSATKIDSKENMKKNNDLLEHMHKLQNEKHEILNEIQQLEISTLGQSDIDAKDSNIELVRKSIEKVTKCLEVRNSKTVCLEQTLHKVQTSSQMLLKKAEEAKKMVEKEKIKILKEKEEALWDKQRLEKHFLLQKQELDNQILHDKSKIRELESELCNHRFNIIKLEGELINLQKTYQGALSNNSMLHDKNRHLESIVNECQDTINKANNKIDEQGNEIKSLMLELNNFRHSKIFDEILYDAKEVQTDTTTSTVPVLRLIDYDIVDNLPKCSNKIIDDIVDFQTKSAIVEALSRELKNNEISNEKSDSSQKTLVDRISVSENIKHTNYNKRNTTKLTRSPIEQHSIQSLADRLQGQNSNALSKTNSSQVYINIFEKENSAKIDLNEWQIEEEVQIKTEFTDLFSKPLKLKKQKTKVNTAVEVYLPENYLPKELDQKSVNNLSSDMKANESSIFRIYDDIEEHNEVNKTSSAIDLMQFNHTKTHKNLTKNSSHNSVIAETEYLKKDIFSVDSKGDSQPTFSVNAKNKYNNNKYMLQTVYESEFDKITKFNIDNGSELKQDYFNKNGESLSKKTPKRNETSGKQWTLRSNTPSLDNVDHSVPLLENYLVSERTNPANMLSLTQASNQHEEDTSQNSKIFEGLDVVSGAKQLETSGKLENDVKILKSALAVMEKDCSKKICAIKIQYDANIQRIINEHNEGVRSLQKLHEETIKDIIKCHENELDSLRTTSMEAGTRTKELGEEDRDHTRKLPETVHRDKTERRATREAREAKLLSTTIVEAFDVKPRRRGRGQGSCCCDANAEALAGVAAEGALRCLVNEGARQDRKQAEEAYLKGIASKLLRSGETEGLKVAELSFLHVKVCRAWKAKLGRGDGMQKKIISFESHLMKKQHHAQQHISELETVVAEEHRRLRRVRAAMCTGGGGASRTSRSPRRPNTPDDHCRASELYEACSCFMREDHEDDKAFGFLEYRDGGGVSTEGNGCSGGTREFSTTALVKPEAARARKARLALTDTHQAMRSKLEKEVKEETVRREISDELPTRLDSAAHAPRFTATR